MRAEIQIAFTSSTRSATKKTEEGYAQAMSKQTILVIEDEIDILDVIEYNLKREGYDVLKCLDGEVGLLLAREKNPHLILLDLMLPGLDGMEVSRRLKQDPLTRETPIIMVTAKEAETDVVSGLRLGADDYIAKPFRPRELVARVEAVLRRIDKERVVTDEDRLERIGIVIDPTRHEVSVDGEPLDFTVTELRILHLLMTQPGRVFTREQIASRAMGQVFHPNDRNIDVHIKTIRKKLGQRRQTVETVRGLGYRFSDRSAG